jgi:hypothetical protein
MALNNSNYTDLKKAVKYRKGFLEKSYKNTQNVKSKKRIREKNVTQTTHRKEKKRRGRPDMKKGK